MKKESKSDRNQMNLSPPDGFKERMDKLGAKVGVSGNQFAVECLERFADTILEFLIEERELVAKLHEDQRKRLLEMARLARSQRSDGQRK